MDPQKRERAPPGNMGSSEPLKIIFPGSRSNAPVQHKQKKGCFGSFMHFFNVLSLWTLLKMTLVIGLFLYEFTKLNTCFIQHSDLVNRDMGAQQESVCTDHTKVAMFGHRFNKGCEDAIRSVQEGIIHGTYTCFVEKHQIYSIASFDNMYMNIAIVCIFLYMLSLVKDYYTQTHIAKQHMEVYDKMGWNPSQYGALKDKSTTLSKRRSLKKSL